MTRYRKKPVEIDAWLFAGLHHLGNMPAWAASVTQDRAGSDSLFINTSEGVMEASPGDFLIQGVKGEVYPCKPDIFYLTYDIVG